ncbi:MAG: HPr-rel-A system PqqD family peptide chaperone [Solirubrobacteraceae bacterium]|nr:HPr-rel-A system PqqD family peptide chaperone [Patulibacter sp.]
MQLRTADVSWRDVDNDVVLLDERTWKYVHLNAAASVLWRALVEGPQSETDLESRLVDEFDIDSDRARDDVSDFVAQLRSREYVE